MSTAEPHDHELPDPQDLDFIRALNALHARAELSRAEKAQALHEWSQEQTDEEILDEFGLDMDVLREDP